MFYVCKPVWSAKGLRGEEWIRKDAVVERGPTETVRLTAAIYKDIARAERELREKERQKWQHINDKL